MRTHTETVCTQPGDQNRATAASRAACWQHLTLAERARQQAREVRIQVLSDYRRAKSAFCRRAARISFSYAFQWKGVGLVKAEIKGELLQMVADALEGGRPVEALTELRELLCRSLRREMPWEPQPVSWESNRISQIRGTALAESIGQIDQIIADLRD